MKKAGYFGDNQTDNSDKNTGTGAEFMKLFG